MKTVSSALLRRYDAAFVILRLAVGSVFIAHGLQKLLVQTVPGVTDFFAQGGIPYPEITAPLVTLVEVFGGIALVLGLVTRLAAFALAIDMIAAMLLVHLPNGFFLPGGFEFVMVLAAASVFFVFAGAGAFSVDAWMASRRHPIYEDVEEPRHVYPERHPA